MFSHEERHILANNQLAEVICQFRFPDILVINSQLPADFQETIREEFPLYSSRRELRVPSPGVNKQEQPIINHQFETADHNWRINLTCNFISLSCSRYSQWDDFASKLDKPLAAFIQLYQPAHFTRIGLRYLNFISRKRLNLEGVPFSDLIEPAYLGILDLPDVCEEAVNRNTVDAELMVRHGCRLKIHSGPGTVAQNGVADREIHFIIDLDLYKNEEIPVQACPQALHALHRQAYPIFRGAIQERLFLAMEPN